MKRQTIRWIIFFCLIINPKIASERSIAMAKTMLEAVVDHGTGSVLKNPIYKVAGKTGTTQNNADGWFMSISPDVICGAWVGGQSPVVRFRSTALGQGAATALPIVATWLKDVSTDPKKKKVLGYKFPLLSGDALLDMNCPLYIESKTENLLDNLFDKDRREQSREIREEARKREQENKDDDGSGWFKNLFDKSKKK